MAENNTKSGELFYDFDNIFKWNPIINEENTREIRIETPENNQFSYQNFIVDLVKSYELYDKRKFPEALEVINVLENMLNDLIELKCTDELFIKIKDALWHIILSSRYVLLANNKKTEEAVKLASTIKQVGNMDFVNKAGIHAIKSSVLALYSFEGIEPALNHINTAISLDSQNPYWLFLKVTYLMKRRLSLNPNVVPTAEEKELIEKAEVKEENALFKVYKANIYSKTASHAHNRRDGFSSFFPDESSKAESCAKIQDRFRQASELYKKSLDLRPDCPTILFHCADGMMDLPKPYLDANRAFQLLNDGLEKSPEYGYGHLVMCKYQMKFGKDMKKMREHLDTCIKQNIFQAHINMIAIKFNENKNTPYDVVAKMTNLMSKFREYPKLGIILSQLISFYMFVKYDLREACVYFLRAVRELPDISSLKAHKSCFLPSVVGLIDLIDVVLDEAKFQLWNMNNNSEMLDFLKDFEHDLLFENIVFSKSKPQNFRRQILQIAGIVPNRKPIRRNDLRNRQNNCADDKPRSNVVKNDVRNRPIPPLIPANVLTAIRTNKAEPSRSNNCGESKVNANKNNKIRGINELKKKTEPSVLQPDESESTEISTNNFLPTSNAEQTERNKAKLNKNDESVRNPMDFFESWRKKEAEHRNVANEENDHAREASRNAAVATVGNSRVPPKNKENSSRGGQKERTNNDKRSDRRGRSRPSSVPAANSSDNGESDHDGRRRGRGGRKYEKSPPRHRGGHRKEKEDSRRRYRSSEESSGENRRRRSPSPPSRRRRSIDRADEKSPPPRSRGGRKEKEDRRRWYRRSSEESSGENRRRRSSPRRRSFGRTAEYAEKYRRKRRSSERSEKSYSSRRPNDRRNRNDGRVEYEYKGRNVNSARDNNSPTPSPPTSRYDKTSTYVERERAGRKSSRRKYDVKPNKRSSRDDSESGSSDAKTLVPLKSREDEYDNNKSSKYGRKDRSHYKRDDDSLERKLSRTKISDRRHKIDSASEHSDSISE